MEILQSQSDTRPETVVIGPTLVLINTNIVPYREEQEDCITEGFRYTTYRMTHTEYQGIQASYTGNVPVLRIIHLKAKLADTDYVVAKIAEAVDQSQLRLEYAQVLENRRQWRSEIQSLERD